MVDNGVHRASSETSGVSRIEINVHRLRVTRDQTSRNVIVLSCFWDAAAPVLENDSRCNSTGRLLTG